MRNVIAILFLLLSVVSFAQDNNTPVPFTLGDRDRLMRNEQKIESLHIEIDALRTEMNIKFESIQKNMNTRFEAVQDGIKATNARIDDLKDQYGYIMALLIFIIGAMMSLIGFVVYDRRTAIKPVQRSQDRLEDILVEYSKENKKLRELLKNAGML
jgi:hypothetical protein